MDKQSRLILDLITAFGEAPSLGEAFDEAYPLLKRLVPADHGALCLIPAEELGTFDWASADLPETFFRPYDEMAGEDFVLAAVSQSPNQAFRDQEMGQRSDLEKSRWYHYCRDLRMPIEHVMAAMLSVDQAWHGGLVLYRDRKKPFSDAERAVFQMLIKPLGSKLGICKRLWDTQQKATALETVMATTGLETIIFSPAGREVTRTQGASKLIERWYPSVPRGSGGVPEHLHERVKAAAKKGGVIASKEIETLERTHESLRVSLVPVPEQGRISLALFLEVCGPEIAPECLARLTPAQIAVVKCVIQGWETPTITEHLGIKAGTLKKHLWNIFEKLGVSNRAALIACCRRRR